MAKKKAKGNASKEAKRAKQQEKAAKKSGKKDGNKEEDDLDMLLEKYKQKDSKILVVELKVLEDKPRPRNYCSMNHIGDGDFLLFGGEYFDGEKAKCFNDLYRYSSTKDQWTQVLALSPPPPRCSHQAVTATVGDKLKLYIFGGEFSTANSFMHYRDLWELDVETNTFTNILTKTGPSARSGHKMVVVRHYIILFGGFYETAKGTNFFNDVHLFNIRTQKWFQPSNDCNDPNKPSISQGNKPLARSAFHFHVDKNEKDCMIMFGGYLKEKNKGKSLDDMWYLKLDFQPNDEHKVAIRWERISKKGITQPGKLSGAASLFHKNKIVLFGGVKDNETINDVEGDFFSDIYMYDLKRHRWYNYEPAYIKNQRKQNLEDEAMYTIEAGEAKKVMDDEQSVISETAKPMDIIPKEPQGRIGATCFSYNNNFFVLYGTCELGDFHLNFDDFWKINLSKSSDWVCLAEGKWEDKVKAVEEDMAENSEYEGDSNMEEDSDTLESDSDASEYSPEVIKALQEKCYAFEDQVMPEYKEELKDFFLRTADFWISEHIKILSQSDTQDVHYQGKEIRRGAFELCHERYLNIGEVVKQLGELEIEQKQSELKAERRIKLKALKEAKQASNAGN